MASNTQKQLAQAALGTSDAALFTGTAGHTYTLGAITVCNTDTVERTFRLHLVLAAGTSAAANALYYDFAMPANQTIFLPRGYVIEGAGMIRGLASAAGVICVTVPGIDSL